MKKKILVFALILAPALSMAAAKSATNSLADILTQDFENPPPGGGNGPGSMPPDNPCMKLNLSADQKAQIKELLYQSAQKRADTEAGVKKAMIVLGHTFSSSTSTKDEGATAQDNLSEAIAADVQVRSDLDLNVTYDVLQPEQREDAFFCSMFMRHRSHPRGPKGHNK